MIHHLNCASFRPLLGAPMVAHCLLVERPEGLLLVDTGFGTGDLADPKRLGQPFRALVRPDARSRRRPAWLGSGRSASTRPTSPTSC